MIFFISRIDYSKFYNIYNLSGLGTNSEIKQKQGEALPLGESATLEAQPINFDVGG